MKYKTQLYNIQHLYIYLYFFYFNLNRMVYLNLSYIFIKDP
jgi:hypothetical protein